MRNIVKNVFGHYWQLLVRQVSYLIRAEDRTRETKERKRGEGREHAAGEGEQKKDEATARRGTWYGSRGLRKIKRPFGYRRHRNYTGKLPL
jgi:hypothetical protein